MSPIAAGTTIMWPGTAASIPAGWTRVAGLDSRHPKGTAAAVNPAVNGGAATHTHTPNTHTHSVAAHAHSGNSATGSVLGTISRASGGVARPSATHTHTRPNSSSDADTLAALAGTWDSPSSDPSFYGCIFIESDGTPTQFPSGCILWLNTATPPTGWQQHVASKGLYIKGAAAAGNGGTTGGANTHGHTAGSHSHTAAGTHTGGASGTPSASQNMTTGASVVGVAAHTHVISYGTSTYTNPGTVPTADTVSHEPEYHRLQAIEATMAVFGRGGEIALWLGTLASIPTNWKLCDGSNGTPDLRGKFIKAVTLTANIGDTGGAATHLHTGVAHTHDSAHTHSGTAGPPSSEAALQTGSGITAIDNQHGHSAVASTSAAGASGNGTQDAPSVNHEPAFRTVAYIMREVTDQLATPPTLALVMSFFAPTVATPRRATPPPLALALTFFPPTVHIDRQITPDPLALVLTFYAPIAFETAPRLPLQLAARTRTRRVLAAEVRPTLALTARTRVQRILTIHREGNP